MTARIRFLVTMAMAAPLLAACSSATRSAGTQPASAAPGSQTVQPAPGAHSAAEFEAIFNARQDSLRARFTQGDVRFMSNMIGHHAQALEMSRLAPSHGASASIQTLAARIINAQKDEIAIMQQWLRDRRQTVPEIKPTAAMDHSADHSMHMSGMLTPEQMRQLENARGAAFDRLFLTFMIQHHRGAVSMVNELLTTDGTAQDEAVFKFASDIQADQTSEVTRMERMLAAMPPVTPSP